MLPLEGDFFGGICMDRGTEGHSKTTREMSSTFFPLSFSVCALLLQSGGMERGVSSMSQSCESLRARAKSTVSTTSDISVPRTLLRTIEKKEKKQGGLWGNIIYGVFLNALTVKNNLGMTHKVTPPPASSSSMFTGNKVTSMNKFV